MILDTIQILFFFYFSLKRYTVCHSILGQPSSTFEIKWCLLVVIFSHANKFILEIKVNMETDFIPT